MNIEPQLRDALKQINSGSNPSVALSPSAEVPENDLATLLRSLRRRAWPPLTQEALAHKAGISLPYLQKLETGRARNPSVETCVRLGVALGLDQPEIENVVHAGSAAAEETPASNETTTVSQEDAVGPAQAQEAEAPPDQSARSTRSRSPVRDENIVPPEPGTGTWDQARLQFMASNHDVTMFYVAGRATTELLQELSSELSSPTEFLQKVTSSDSPGTAMQALAAHSSQLVPLAAHVEVDVQMDGPNRVGLLNDITTLIRHRGIDITVAFCQVHGAVATLVFKMDVPGERQWTRLMRELEAKIPGLEVKRLPTDRSTDRSQEQIS